MYKAKDLIIGALIAVTLIGGVVLAVILFLKLMYPFGRGEPSPPPTSATAKEVPSTKKEPTINIEKKSTISAHQQEPSAKDSPTPQNELSAPTIESPVSKPSIAELVEELRKAVETKDDKAIHRAVKQLTEQGVSAAPAMLSLLQTSSDPLLRRMAIAIIDDLLAYQLKVTGADGAYSNKREFFEKFRDPANAELIRNFRSLVIQPLISALENDPDVLTRRWSASALGQVGGLVAAQALAKALRDKKTEWGVSYWAEVALSNIWDDGAVPFMIDLAKDETFSLDGRRSAISSLGLSNTPQALTVLEDLFEEPQFRGAVFAALQYMQLPQAQELIERLKRQQEEELAQEPLIKTPEERVGQHQQEELLRLTQEQQRLKQIQEAIDELISGRPTSEQISNIDVYINASDDKSAKQIAMNHLNAYVGNADAIALSFRIARSDLAPDVKVYAISTLGNIGTAENAKELQRLQDEWSQLPEPPVSDGSFDSAREAIYRRTVLKE